MLIDFQDHFWGDKQNGFDVLYQNLKYGSASAKELSEFLRSRTVIEEYNYNLLLKLSRKTNNQQFGTFNPLWIILKASTEKLSSLHTQTLQRLNQLIKDVTKYCEEHHKKQKQIKTEETTTIDAINELKETIASLNKSKEFYFTKALEVDRLKRENASQKDIEKAEVRVNKACGEYKNLIDKYKKVKADYEKKFRLSCKNFQKLEEDHIKQMKDFMQNYFKILQSGHTLIGQVYNEFQNNCNEMTIERLLDQFIKSKGTGSTKLADIHFEEANLNNFQHLNFSSNSTNTAFGGSVISKTTSTINTPSIDLINLDSMSHSTIKNFSTDFSAPIDSNLPDTQLNLAIVPSSNSRKEGFLRSKKDKIKNKKCRSKKESGDEESYNGSISGSRVDIRESIGNRSNAFAVDSEGYSIRPTQIPKEEDNFNSSSESDTDSDDEKEKKIFVKINPLKNGSQISASVDQLIASAGALTLAPTNHSNRRANLSANPSPTLNDGIIKRSVSATHTAFKSNNQNDLFDIFNSTGTIVTSSSSNINHSSSGRATTNFSSSFDPLADSAKSSIKDDSEEAEKNTAQEITNNTSSTSSDRYAAFSNLFVKPSAACLSHTSVANASALTDSKTAAPAIVTSSAAITTATFVPTSSSSEFTNILPLPPKTNTESSLNTLSNSSLSKSLSSTSIMGTTTFSVYKPLSKSFASYSQSIPSNGIISRADSVSSLSSDFRMTPISLCSSRDSSPLTIGMSDTVPIAIAFQESIGACFKGANENLCKINIIGCIKIAFSSGIIQVFSNNPYLQQLSFKLKNANRLDKIILSKELITQVATNDEFSTYEMNMTALQSSLKRLFETSPNSRYYNLDILKYQYRSLPGARNAPLQLVSHWKCEENTTNLKIDFKYNASAFSSIPAPLKNIQFTANVDGNVSSMQSQPEGKWDSLTKQATWKYNEISNSNDCGFGSIKAKFDLVNGPTCPSSVYVQFSAQDATLSGLEFELIGSGYRLSLMKRQISSGRYYCEPKTQI